MSFYRALIISFPLVAAQPASAAAWIGEEQKTETENRCEQPSQTTQRRRSALGGVLGGIARGALGRAGVPTVVADLALPVGSLLSEELIRMLDCKEQQQAAAATNEAIRGGVGTTTEWTSETRPGVSGRSSVTGEERLADGGHCMTVSDIIIVDGEETTVPKRMCRSPGASGYARV